MSCEVVCSFFFFKLPYSILQLSFPACSRSPTASGTSPAGCACICFTKNEKQRPASRKEVCIECRRVKNPVFPPHYTPSNALLTCPGTEKYPKCNCEGCACTANPNYADVNHLCQTCKKPCGVCCRPMEKVKKAPFTASSVKLDEMPKKVEHF